MDFGIVLVEAQLPFFSILNDGIVLRFLVDLHFRSGSLRDLAYEMKPTNKFNSSIEGERAFLFEG